MCNLQKCLCWPRSSLISQQLRIGFWEGRGGKGGEGRKGFKNNCQASGGGYHCTTNGRPRSRIPLRGPCKLSRPNLLASRAWQNLLQPKNSCLPANQYLRQTLTRRHQGERPPQSMERDPARSASHMIKLSNMSSSLHATPEPSSLDRHASMHARYAQVQHSSGSSEQLGQQTISLARLEDCMNQFPQLPGPDVCILGRIVLLSVQLHVHEVQGRNKAVSTSEPSKSQRKQKNDVLNVD